VGDVKLNCQNPSTIPTPVYTPPTASGGSVIYIKDGTLDLNGCWLQAASTSTTDPTSASGLTIVFTGSGTAKNVSYFPTDSSKGAANGILDIAAPTGGTWHGVALYQDPSMQPGSALDITYKGNSPTWDITGLVYAPNSNIAMKGTINKSANGYQCISIV